MLAGALLFFTAPLMLLVALAIRIEGWGPIFESRRCIAAGGRRFHMLNFRTAPYDRDRRIYSWEQRPTLLGQFLRQTRIDTLPQLLNVLCGDLGLTDPERRSPSFLD